MSVRSVLGLFKVLTFTKGLYMCEVYLILFQGKGNTYVCMCRLDGLGKSDIKHRVKYPHVELRNEARNTSTIERLDSMKTD